MQRVSLLTTLAVTLTALASPTTAQTPGLYDVDTVREIRLYFQQTNYWQQLLNNYSSKTEIEADLKVDGVTYKRVGVRFRGNTSYKRLPASSQKRGFNIRLDSNIPGQDLYGYDHLNLNNGYHDPTFMREVVIYQISRRYMSAPKANFVKVYLNDQYWGIYINVQQPNGDMMDEWYREGAGNRYRGFPSVFPFERAALIWLGATVAPYQTAYEFKKGDGTDLLKLITVLNQTPQNQLQAELPKVWSVDQGYWYCICMNGMVQTDSYIGSGKDHFLYHDPFHDTFHIFPFDVNEGFGAEGNASSNLSPFYNTTNSKRPILSQTMQFARWKARYIAHYRTFVEESFSWQELGGLITKYQKMIANDVAADAKKIYTTAQFSQNVTQDVVIGRTRIRGLKPLIEARRLYLDSVTEFKTTRPSLSGLTLTPAKPQASQSPVATVTAGNAAQATLYYRAKGPFIEVAMFDDGKHGDGQANDGVWGNSIPAQAAGSILDYYVSATTTAGVMRFLPAKAEHGALSYRVQWPTGTSPIVINELVAKNNTGAKDEANEFEDWLELHNTSNQAVNVAGMYLSDKFENATKWQVPTNQTAIPAGGSLLVWCDEDGTQGPLHANFKLSSSGEEVFLFSTDGRTLLDTLQFGQQTADVATGRLFDGLTPWVTLPSPTPNALNAPGTGGTRPYSALRYDAHRMALGLSAPPKLGTKPNLTVANGVKSGPLLLMISVKAGYLPLQNVTILVGYPTGIELLLALDTNGAANLPVPIPNDQKLAGVPFYLQSFSLDTSGFVASNGLEIIAIK